MKFIIPPNFDTSTIFIALVQIYCHHDSFQMIKLHDNITFGTDSRKYRHLRDFWSAHHFRVNSLGYVLETAREITHPSLPSSSGGAISFADYVVLEDEDLDGVIRWMVSIDPTMTYPSTYF